MYIPCDKTFPLVPTYFTLRPWPLTYIFKPLTWIITFEPLVVGLSYVTCVFLVTRPFRQYLWACNLDVAVRGHQCFTNTSCLSFQLTSFKIDSEALHHWALVHDILDLLQHGHIVNILTSTQKEVVPAWRCLLDVRRLGLTTAGQRACWRNGMCCHGTISLCLKKLKLLFGCKNQVRLFPLSNVPH